jgi:hypothetical protein
MSLGIKRKSYSMQESRISVQKRKTRPRLKLEDAPAVNSISDLIEIGKTIKFYKNLDTIMLWRIIPYLEELNKMVGMDSLKETIFYQVIYYLQGMHTKSKNEEYLHTAIYGPPGCGKCLGKNTPVMLHNGNIKMVQDITTKDILMGDDSSPRNIISICTGSEQMYEIQQLYGDNYTVNESHILSLKLSTSPKISDNSHTLNYHITWYSETGLNSRIFSYENTFLDKQNVKDTCIKFMETLPQKGTVIDISVKDYLQRNLSWKKVYKGYKVHIEFPKKNIDLEPYVLGYLLADNNPEINDKSIEYYKKTYKTIPDEYKYNDTETRLQVLAGILDSNGYLYKNFYEIFQKNEIFANDIIWLSRSLGFKTTLSTCVKSSMYKNQKKSENYYKIIISGNIHTIPCKIPQKQATQIHSITDVLVYDIKVKKLQVEKYYGFEIDGNSRFLLGDFTVTHNTTVAKIIGKIYQSLGVLSPNGCFKVAYRDDFVAGYLGQTANKTKKLLSSCIGGVLFIDEVYSLAPRNNDKDSFAKEAIDTLNGFLSEHKNDFCCIVAGYEDEVINCFFAMNKGLERRFPWIHRIPEYKSKELYQIFMKMVKDIEWDTCFEEKFLMNIFDRNKDMFKNAGGDIETFITKCKMFHSQRVFSLGKEHKFILNKQDVEKALDFIQKNNKPKDDGPPSHMYT